MNKVSAFGTAFLHYFISEQVSHEMADVVADNEEISFTEAMDFCERNEHLLGKAYGEVWKVIERIGEEAK